MTSIRLKKKIIEKLNLKYLVFTAQQRSCMDFLMRDPFLIIKNNFDLDKTEQIELMAKLKEFYFNNQYVQESEQIVDVSNSHWWFLLPTYLIKYYANFLLSCNTLIRYFSDLHRFIFHEILRSHWLLDEVKDSTLCISFHLRRKFEWLEQEIYEYRIWRLSLQFSDGERILFLFAKP